MASERPFRSRLGMEGVCNETDKCTKQMSNTSRTRRATEGRGRLRYTIRQETAVCRKLSQPACARRGRARAGECMEQVWNTCHTCSVAKARRSSAKPAPTRQIPCPTKNTRPPTSSPLAGPHLGGHCPSPPRALPHLQDHLPSSPLDLQDAHGATFASPTCSTTWPSCEDGCCDGEQNGDPYESVWLFASHPFAPPQELVSGRPADYLTWCQEWVQEGANKLTLSFTQKPKLRHQTIPQIHKHAGSIPLEITVVRNCFISFT